MKKNYIFFLCVFYVLFLGVGLGVEGNSAIDLMPIDILGKSVQLSPRWESRHLGNIYENTSGVYLVSVGIISLIFFGLGLLEKDNRKRYLYTGLVGGLVTILIRFVLSVTSFVASLLVCHGTGGAGDKYGNGAGGGCAPNILDGTLESTLLFSASLGIFSFIVLFLIYFSYRHYRSNESKLIVWFGKVIVLFLIYHFYLVMLVKLLPGFSLS